MPRVTKAELETTVRMLRAEANQNRTIAQNKSMELQTLKEEFERLKKDNFWFRQTVQDLIRTIQTSTIRER